VIFAAAFLRDAVTDVEAQPHETTFATDAQLLMTPCTDAKRQAVQ
jgi:hypothetical protein